MLTDEGFSIDVKHWVWDQNVNVESVLTMFRGSWLADYDEPIVEQTILITETKIDDAELATIDLNTDDDKFFWFDRLKFTYQTEFNITYLVDECKSDSYMDGQVFSAVDCPWEVLPYGHRI